MKDNLAKCMKRQTTVPIKALVGGCQHSHVREVAETATHVCDSLVVASRGTLNAPAEKPYLVQDVDNVALSQSQLILVRSVIGKGGPAVLFRWGDTGLQVQSNRDMENCHVSAALYL